MASSITELIRVERGNDDPVGEEGYGRDDVVRRLDELNDIGAALSFEKDLNALLERILMAAKTITRADGGTLYLVEGEEDARRLRFAIMRTDSLGMAMGGTTECPIPFAPIELRVEGQPNVAMVAAYAAIHGATVNVSDAYAAAGFDFSGTRHFDRQTGYRSRSFLTVPMKNHANETIGVLQLINCTDPVSGRITDFSKSDQRLAESLASQAAVALTNRQLIMQLERLFESFIELINTAIDEKSSYTGGHCQRVPQLTMMIAEAVDRTTAGPLSSFRMTDADRYELHIAGLLHDCGKITTPVHIVDKATKLQAIFDRIHLVDQRFEVLKRDAEIEAMRARLALAEDAAVSAAERLERHARIEAALEERIAALESDRAFLGRANVGAEAMPQSDVERVRRIASAYRWRDASGEEVDFLSPDEVKNLTIRAGTLTEEERRLIRNHIASTNTMLESLPWPRHLRNVPEYAGGHHERMDGRGYPRGLSGDQMSVQARIMAIADIFEALTAKDRPYKRGNKLSEAMYILGQFASNGHIDPEIFKIFVREKVYLHYAGHFVDPAQVDAVDEARLPGYSG